MDLLTQCRDNNISTLSLVNFNSFRNSQLSRARKQGMKTHSQRPMYSARSSLKQSSRSGSHIAVSRLLQGTVSTLVYCSVLLTSSSFLLWRLLPTHCRCKGLLLHLITLTDTHTHSVGLPWTRDRPLRRGLYLHNTQHSKRQTSMPSAAFEPASQQASGRSTTP